VSATTRLFFKNLEEVKAIGFRRVVLCRVEGDRLGLMIVSTRLLYKRGRRVATEARDF
jgi:hypothetical protein